MQPNILLITLDQFRAEALSCAGHPVVQTPNLDRLARQGARLARHFSQAAPCSPGRASLYTGMYQQNHRVVANGTPLDRRFDNIAYAARRAGYEPTLFGYTDQSVDPRDARGPTDPRLSDYEEVLPGFDVNCKLVATAPWAWRDALRAAGFVVPDGADELLRSEPQRPAEHSMSAFLVDRFLEWLHARNAPWFAHVSLFRPHPPYAAAGAFSTMYSPADVPAPIAPSATPHRFHAGLMRHPAMRAPEGEAALRAMRAQYYGMVSEVDARGEWDDTFLVVTADHADHLGDHGLVEKGGYFEQAYHIVGLVRDPGPDALRGIVVNAFTENVDVLPTLCEAMGIAVPAQCDGLPLGPWLRGETPRLWRNCAHWEYDWRFTHIPNGPHDWPWDRRLERQNMAVARYDDLAFVQFASGESLCFDLATDPTWRTTIDDPARLLRCAQDMLAWRAQHLERLLTGMLVENGGIGRWPPLPDDWHARTTQGER